MFAYKVTILPEGEDTLTKFGGIVVAENYVEAMNKITKIVDIDTLISVDLLVEMDSKPIFMGARELELLDKLLEVC